MKYFSNVGEFRLNESTGELTLSRGTNTITLGTFGSELDTTFKSRRAFMTFVKFYCNILHTETIMDFFNVLEVPNEYKDAVLRTKINVGALTRQVREHQQPGFDYLNPDIDLSVSPNSDYGTVYAQFRTPLGRYIIVGSDYDSNTIIPDVTIYHEETQIGIVSTIFLDDLSPKIEYIFDNALKLCELHFFDLYQQRRKETEKKVVDLTNYVFGNDALRSTLKAYSDD